jgi:hypothetical protein
MPCGVRSRLNCGQDRFQENPRAVSLNDREEGIVARSRELHLEAQAIAIKSNRRRHVPNDEERGDGGELRSVF